MLLILMIITISVNICAARDCCFHWGKENCVAENEDSKGDLLLVVKESCSKLNLLTEAGEERCEEICEERACCFDPDLSRNCWKTTPEICEGYEPCANMNIKDEDLLKEFCSKEKIASGLGYAVCEVLCTTRPCCFVEGEENCVKEFPAWCSSMEICSQNLDMPAIMKSYDRNSDANIVRKVCSDAYLQSEGQKGKQDCKELCSERACCFLPGRDNCSSKYKDWCEEFSTCNNLDFFNTNNYDDDYYGDDIDDAGEYDDDTDDYEVEALEKVCAKAVINKGDNYDQCKDLCQQRECCFHWGKENCVEEQEDWCDDFRACYNLDWADEKENEDTNGDLLLVIKESCSKLNILTDAGGERCEEICEDRECCYDPDPSRNCRQAKPEYCNGYEACAHLNIKDKDLLEEFCSEEKVYTGIGYAVCEVMCTTRQCCFLEGDENCAKQFPQWCSSMEICNQNLDMPTIMKDYDASTDATIVEKVCDGVEYLPEGHQSKKNCKELCSERACCFLPGRNNCSSKYKDWCNEFAPCNNLDSFEIDDDSNHDETYDDQDDDQDDAHDDQIDDEYDEMIAIRNVCAKNVINHGSNYDQCKHLCDARECCFHWGKENCVEEKEDWCDDFRVCYNLDWADEKENEDSKGDLKFVLEEACSKLNILTEAGGERCGELCEDKDCCFESDLSKNCLQAKPEFCEGYQPCANLSIKDEDLLKEYCSEEKVSTGLGYAVCEVLCTTRKCCFLEGDNNCAKQFPSWCSSMDICSKNLDMPSIMKNYNSLTDASIVQKVCADSYLQSEGKEGKKACRELCSERACCFLPGRDNCSKKYSDWCEEFAPCNNLDLSEDDEDYDYDYEENDDDDASDQNEETKPIKVDEQPNSSSQSKNDPTAAPTEATPADATTNNQVDEICGKENVKTETGRYHCESICSERQCCFLVGFGNCYTSSQEWCDEYKSCQNLFFS